MPRDSYMPSAQADQVVWSQRFVDVACANAVQYGLSVGMVADFTGKNTDLQAAWAAAIDLTTRTKANVATKDVALAAMKAAAKPLISVIQGTPGVTEAMLINAGLTVRKTTPTKKPVPTVAPYLEVVGNVGRTVTLELRSSKTKRGKPSDVFQATIFTHVGAVRPVSEGQWQFAMNAMKTSVQLAFPPSDVGDTVWIVAFWQNAKGQSGPAATPVSVDLPAGGVMPSTAAAAKPSMKLRAA